MGAAARPEFDRAAAKAAGYSDAEIDAFLAAQAPAPSRAASVAAGLLQAPLQGIVPIADEVSAGIGTVIDQARGALTGQDAGTWGAAYARNLAANRQANRDAADVRVGPLAPAAMLEAAGSVVPVAGAVHAAEGGRALTQIARAARDAGLLGAAQGIAGSDGGVGDRAVAGLVGAGAGGPLGAGAGALARPLTGAVEWGVGKATGEATDPFRRRAAAFLARRLADDGTTPAELAARYRAGAVPADAPLAETAGLPTASLLRDVRVLGGEGGRKVERAMHAMQEGQQGRVRGAVRDALGGEAPNVVDFAQQLAEERAAQGSPLFEQANRETGLIDNPRFQQLIQTPWGRRMWNEAQVLLAQDEHALPRATRDVTRPAAPVVAPDQTAFQPSGGTTAREEQIVPDLRALHYFRMALDNALEHPNEFRVKLPNGETSGTATTVQAQLQRMRGEVTGMLHGASDTFRQADESWARNSGRMRAFAAGQRFTGATANEITVAARALTDDTRGVWRSGAAADVERVLGDVRDRRDALGRVWETPALREKFRAALGADDYARLEAAMQREVGRRDLTTRVLGGPNTADKLRGTEELMGPVPGAGLGAAVSAARGNPGPATAWLLDRAMRARARWMGQGTGNAIADLALADDPNAALAALIQEALRTSRRDVVTNAAGRAGGMLGGQGGRGR